MGAGLSGGWVGSSLTGASAALTALRVAMLGVLAPAYERRGLPYWLSPIADPLAVARLFYSTVRRPTVWRGRNYGSGQLRPEV
jgi:dolichol-phosphate mannosyltransferase